MPEYLAPGVFVEEVSYRSKSIEGVSTTTTGFIGPTRYGPLDGDLEVITSLTDYEATYGDGRQLEFEGGAVMHNYVWHAVRVFFEQGGKRLFVKRVYEPPARGDGRASGMIGAVRVAARHPGAAGAGTVRITLSLGPNILARDASGQTRAMGIAPRDVVWVVDQPAAAPASPPASGDFYVLDVDAAGVGELHPAAAGSPPPPALKLADLTAVDDPALTDVVRVVTASVTFVPPGAEDAAPLAEGLALDAAHRRAGADDSLPGRFAADPLSAADARTLPVTIDAGGLDGGALLLELLGAAPGLQAALLAPSSSGAARSIEVTLQGGGDGQRPGSGAYLGVGSGPDDTSGLRAFEDVEDISIVAAPGSTFGFENGWRSQGAAITQALIGHAERMRYRIAVLDCGEGQTIGEASAMRGAIDTTHGAFYYPWVRVLDPITQQELNLPPSGFVAGIYARNDVNRAVYKAPANEVVTGAIGFERTINTAQQEVLNPLGVNCFRFFEGRGFRLWGARTATSDPEWKYVNLRRYFAYLERSIDRGTQWAVFEPNGEALWANVRRTISDFLLNEFQMGALLGDKPDKAYFVKCDRSTMTQNDLDNGRLVCLIGVAALRPAEFVIFRIGQWTADRKV
jgi:phage tail sheath protein FI